MPLVPVHGVDDDAIRAGLVQIRDELELPGSFPSPVLAEAAESVASARLDDAVDRLDLPFVTIDPPGAQDLDQAVAFERAGADLVVHYAIADVGRFVTPGGAVDAEARRRGVTVYLPDGKVSLHPPAIAEDVASLLPDRARPALLWSLRIDESGTLVDIGLERALVRSRAALDYAAVQRAVESGASIAGTDVAGALRDAGERLLGAEAARGGASLALPDQEVDTSGDRWRLVYRAPLDTERWNAQISLLAGRAAARLMVDAGHGIVRTLPEPAGDDLAQYRREVQCLGVDWPDGTTYAEVVRGLDPAIHVEAALLVQATRLFRGAGYAPFTGGDAPAHAAVAAPYAHVTAPIRRLVDRFANEIVLAHVEGRRADGWATEALEALPDLMQHGRSVASNANRLAIDLMEAAVLAHRVGDVLHGVVVDDRGDGARVQLLDPAVVARVADAPRVGLGDVVDVRVEEADVVRRKVALALA